MDIGFFDSHAHYYDEKFKSENVDADALLSDLFDKSVQYIINVGTNNDNSLECINQAKKYERMYTAVGIHPSDCYYLSDIDAEMKKLSALLDNAKENKIVAIGEIGFDYHFEETDKPKQREYFSRQLEEAKKRNLPVIIHDRDAHGDTSELLRTYRDVRGVLHSFSGSAEMAREVLANDWYISFSGVVTFSNASRVREVVKTIPLDRLLIETDCPYLAPHPFRGRINHSGYLEYTAAVIAEIFGVPFEKIVQITNDNAKRFFRIK